MSNKEILRANRALAKDQLKSVGQGLLAKYDLSPSKARELSNNLSKKYRFHPHNLLSKDGNPKTGGGQRNGTLKIDLYISYRLGDTIFALTAIQDIDSDVLKYEVLGPKDFIDGFKDFTTLRNSQIPYEGIIEGGVICKSFEEAVKTFVELIDKNVTSK